MRDNMYENGWSPFDPKWYQEAFDKFVSTADQLFNQDLIIKQGYHIPDADGSKSSVFRNNAVLNNSFNEKLLRETLKDIYLNSSHKLVASNHDNVHFFQWNGYMSNMTFIPNTNLCQFTIPTDTFIYPKERDLYKLSQFYRKWIKVEDVLNNWNVFKWHCMLFIDQKVYTEYELRIDDHEVAIRFKYYDYWVKMNHPVYIYKFDTNAQCRILVSRELCANQWKWKVPINYINDQRVASASHVMVAFNKISDTDIRKDGLTNIETLGDNLEFLEVKDGYIDISKISDFNKTYISSESTEWLWMSIIVPKFFHEYPILLPTDVIYRPYVSDFQKVVTLDHDRVQYVKSNIPLDKDPHQIYIDMNGRLNEIQDGWKQMIRPIVLADAFDNPIDEPYEAYMPELSNLRDLTVKGADIIESFRFFIQDYTTDDEFNKYLEELLNIINLIRDAHNTFLDKLSIELNQEYERLFKKFLTVMQTIKEDGVYSEWFNSEEESDRDFWFFISPLIYIPRELADRYFVMNIIDGMGDQKILWDEINEFMGKIRFQRPIEEHDFWTFEYDPDNKVWRPYPLEITRHFPDVYIPKDPTEENPTLNRIFKTFFFYSDTMNVLEESNDIVRATPSWDLDMQEYEFERGAVYRDIFMEKFYWMGVRSIYRGILSTKCRWEAIEYVIDNDSYYRFNELFLNTMDPYFKLGLATYLKSANYEFPFDDAISKMEESIISEWNGYKKVTNFEIYLNKTWIPSYFDYITRIMDDWDYSNRLLRRPRRTFDILRLLPILIEIQTDIAKAVKSLIEDLDWILKKLAIENYRLNVADIQSLKELALEMDRNINEVLDFTTNLDLQIYSIDDVNFIISLLEKHIELSDEIRDKVSDILSDTEEHCVYEDKRELLNLLTINVNKLPEFISIISGMVQEFDMDGFMKAVNDLRSYFDHAKTNPDDKSLIGYVNKFDDPWSKKVKEMRNNLFTSTSILYGTFEPLKSYENEEVIQFVELIQTVKNDVVNLRNTTSEFWTGMGYDKDQLIIDRLDHAEEYISKLIMNINRYIDARDGLMENFDTIRDILDKMDEYNISDTEQGFRSGILIGMDNMLTALSYIAGKNNREEAIAALDEIKRYILSWNGFINNEEEVFVRLFKVVKPPVEFLEILGSHQEILEAIMIYMDTVNTKFIPDTSWPTYSDIYSVDNIEIVSGGFRNNIGETVFVPSLGSYKITEVSDNVSRAVSVEDTGYRKTIFRDPMCQSSPYDTITDGVGLGITIKAMSSNHIRIMNDQVISSFIMRVQNSTYLVSRDIQSPNPYNNRIVADTLNGIGEIKVDWDKMLKIYRDYMSDQIYEATNEIIALLQSVIPATEIFMETREKIDLAGLLDVFNKFIEIYTSFFTDLDKLDETFEYYDSKCKESYDELLAFYDNGTTWNDTTLLKTLLVDAQSSVNLFQHKMLIDMKVSDALNKVMEIYNSTVTMIDVVRVSIDSLPNAVVDTNQIIRQVESKVRNIPTDLKKDLWYRLKNIGVAEEGKNYKVGDIVEIIPELPKDKDGNPIRDMEDIVMNDVILLQITGVQDGMVESIQPLMDYAVPYLIWGIRSTKTRVGIGTGLVIDAYSYEIQLSDSTLFDSVDSDISLLPQFDENDLFMFKFENIHDLDINYEVFYGGKQITTFAQRHESDNNPLHPKNIDVLYLNANDVMNLRNSSVFIPAEHYFIYRLDKIEVVDPGAGYALGQDIFVDVESMALKLTIIKLLNSPYKGIADADLGDGKIMYNGGDPSSSNAKVATDSLNNIDDEFNVGYYDKLPREGIVKGSTISLDPEKYQFVSKRFDNLESDDRNKNYMYPDVDMPLTEDTAINGDPDHHWYQGSRIDNSQHPYYDPRRWNGIMNLVPPTDPFISDCDRMPPNKPIKGEYQTFGRMRFHNSNPEDAIDSQIVSDDVTSEFDFTIKNHAMITGDIHVDDFAHLPRHTVDWPKAAVGKTVIVECDETNDGHRMMYRLRTFVAAGFFVYDLPEIADISWNHIDVDWMDIDYYPDYPSLKTQYPSAPWRTSKTYRGVVREITDKKHTQDVAITHENNTSYIHDMLVDDISVWNWTTHEWEDLHDETRWRLDVINDSENEQWGFRLTLLQEGLYSYDLQFFWNKIPDTQMRNASLKRNAVLDIAAVIAGEVNTPAINTSVNTGRHLRIRKLFPYEQKESFTIGKSLDGENLGYEMDFKLSQYIHYKNEIHLEDIKVYNKSAGRFENIMDRTLFEVRFKDNKAIARGYETQTRIVQHLIGNAGAGFVDGNVWGWNEEFGINVFGYVTAAFRTDGHILTFNPLYCPKPPQQDISLEFQVFQHVSQTLKQMATIMIEFHTETMEVYGDGYIHNVTNRMAPVPKEFKVIVQYDLDSPTEYDIIISKTPRKWTFVEPNWLMAPTFHLPNYNIQQDRVYVLTDKGRFPMTNPSTGKPTLQVVENGNGTDVTFLNLYRRYEHIDVRTTPYPMRSVYVQRRIPSHGFIDLKGKINKPLNKKYFEFWVNGKLLYDEVTIITPTKVFLHGLKSLKNLEIIEVNRDDNEYFSDIFIETERSDYGRPYQKWNYETYLDAALEGNLEEDNYSLDEQEYLLSPVWKQVEETHPEFKNYPPNVDIEDDVLVRVSSDDHPIGEIEDPTYQFIIIDAPTLESHPIVDRNLTFEHFGFIPITDSQIIDILNEEWADEIGSDPYFPDHAVMTDDEWYGTTARLYDEYGIRVHNLNEAAYKVTDVNLLRININNKLSRIIKNPIEYDLN